MKKIIAAAALAALLLTGCATAGTTDANEPEQAYSVYQQTQTLKDGRKVECLIFVGTKKGGLSCDWAGAK